MTIVETYTIIRVPDLIIGLTADLIFDTQLGRQRKHLLIFIKYPLRMGCPIERPGLQLDHTAAGKLFFLEN